jgi:hypothetical protein
MEMPAPKITDLESVVPWKYRSWDRKPDIETLLPGGTAASDFLTGHELRAISPGRL